MTSTAPRPLCEPGAGAAIFSYAQAAKGRTATTTASTTQISQNTSGTNTPRESNSAIITPSGSVNGTINPEIDGGATTNSEAGFKATSGSEAEPKTSIVAAFESALSSPGFAVPSNSTPSKGEEPSVNANDSAWDKQSHGETPVDKPIDGTERKKCRKGKKSAEKEMEAEKEELKAESLVAAPPPAVNIWQKRIEAQAAKVKASPQSTESSQFPVGDPNLNCAVSSGVKPFDSRRKGKISGAEEFDKSTSFSQSGGLKEQQLSTKSQRKGAEGNFGSKEESNGKRFPPRGSRVGEKEDKQIAGQLPPPVEDATLWPTPDTALDEEKRKSQGKQEKEEKDDSINNKPRTKEKWIPVPYTPTVTFSTPLPGRGGRTRGARGRDAGGRGGHASNSSFSAEKISNSTTLASSSGTDSRERGRDSNTLGRAASLPPNASKRPVGESTHDQRKPTSSNSEKLKHENSSFSNKAENPSKDRQPSIPSQAELSSNTHQNPQHAGAEFTKTGKSGPHNGTTSEHYPQSKSAADRRGDGNTRANDTKEVNYHSQTRDRGDGRFERGRGGFRGRGGHANFTSGQHSFTNGHSQQQNGYGTERHNSGPYSPPLQQGQYSNAYQTNPNRGGRAGPRSQSIPTNSAIYTRYPNAPVTAQQIPPLQTTGPVFEYAGMQTLSAMPYNPYIEQYSVLAMVTMQLEYYFSIDNLCKDVYLRKHMDSQGFVFLAFIAKFRRIQSLTSEFDLLRFACQESEIIDIVTGEDGIDRIRRQDGWEKWVLAMEERDESAKNGGPERYFRQQIQTRHQPLAPRMMTQHHPVLSPNTAIPNGAESNYRAYPTPAGPLNGVEHTSTYMTDPPLSAAVPDFAPNSPANEMGELEAETTFTNEEVDNLQLVYNRKSQVETKSKIFGHSSSSRTFSNGSIDGRSISEEIFDLDKRQGQTLVNGGGPPSEM